MMFATLCELDQKVLEKMSDADLYDLSNSATGNEYLEFKPHLNDSTFWTALCRSRFNIVVSDKALAKKKFQEEYLTRAKNIFPAFYQRHRELMDLNNIQAALDNAKKVIRIYGLVGNMLCLEVYQSVVDKGQQENAREYAVKAIQMFDELKNNYNERLSEYFLTELEWRDDFIENHTDLDRFIVNGVDYFKQFLPNVSNRR